MDCKTARLLLAFSRPKAAELEACAAEALNDHLVDCAECGALAQGEYRVERQLGLAMRHVPVPLDLRQRLLTKLRTERRTWYKRLPQRHPRIAAGVAAFLLLAVGLTLYAAVRPLRPLPLELIADQWNTPTSPEDVQNSFAAKGFKVIVPPDFNYEYLDSYGLQEFAGSCVPHLLFIRGQNHASVYILSASRFDATAAVGQPRAGSGRFTVELRLGPVNSNVVYLIKYTGGSLEGFCRDRSNG